MILFPQDWAKYNAFPDYNTSNKSFTHVVRLFHDMGVKNCLFPLALYNRDLVGVNPYDPSLTIEQKTMVAIECKWNPWYFFREVARVPPQSGSEAIPFIANRGNIAVFWLFFNNIDVALIQPRQTGKSTSVDIMMIWLLYIGATNSTISLFTLNDKLRKDNILRLKRARNYLPKYLFMLSKDDADNKYELTYNEHGTRYKTHVGQNAEVASSNQGRGGTAPVMQFDEPPFTPFIGDAIPAALSAGVAVRREAERNGQPYGNIFTTTAGKKDDRDGLFFYTMLQDAAGWTEFYYDCLNKADLVETIKLNGARSKDPKGDALKGKVAMVNITLSHRQLGYDDDWMAENLAFTRSTGEKADRDFFNRWTSGSQKSPLSVRLTEIIRNSEREAIWIERSKDNYLFKWFFKREVVEEMMANGHYVFGLDTSDAGPGDGTALVCIDARDLSVVGRGTYTDTNLFRLSSYFADMLVKYPNTTLVIERKSSGQAIIDALLTFLPKFGVDPFRRMYNLVIQEKSEREDDYQAIKRGVAYRSDRFYDGFKTSFGFFTDGKLRPLLTEVVLQEAAKNAGHLVRDKALIDELMGLTTESGRVDHPKGGHDDHVFAWLMACWFVTYGKNLHEYGIPAGYALQTLYIGGEEVDEEVLEERKEQEEILQQIDAITAEMQNTRDEFIVSKLEHKLKVLISRLSFEDRQHFSVDQLLRSTSEERKKRQLTEAKPYKAMDRNISLGVSMPSLGMLRNGFVRPSGQYWY
jgi:hypothetical protein